MIHHNLSLAIHIWDMRNLRTLENCTIRSKPSRKVLKKSGGYYLYNNLPIGTLELDIRCPGYSNQTLTVEIRSEAQYINLLMLPVDMIMETLCMSGVDDEGASLWLIRHSELHLVETYEANQDHMIIQSERPLLPFAIGVERGGSWHRISLSNTSKEGAYYHVSMASSKAFEISALTSLYYIVEEVK